MSADESDRLTRTARRAWGGAVVVRRSEGFLMYVGNDVTALGRDFVEAFQELHRLVSRATFG